MTVALTKRRFTADEYHQMADAGILTEDDRVELIDGEIVQMVPIGSHHGGGVNRVNRIFSHQFANSAVVSVQNPVRLNDFAEPQPDVALLRLRDDLYTLSHPTPGDVLLIVEVADTSVDTGRQVKVPLYARSGIPEVWLVDLNSATVTEYSDPTPGGCRSARVLRAGEHVAPLTFPDRGLAVAELLGLP